MDHQICQRKLAMTECHGTARLEQCQTYLHCTTAHVRLDLHCQSEHEILEDRLPLHCQTATMSNKTCIDRRLEPSQTEHTPRSGVSDMTERVCHHRLPRPARLEHCQTYLHCTCQTGSALPDCYNVKRNMHCQTAGTKSDGAYTAVWIVSCDKDSLP